MPDIKLPQFEKHILEKDVEAVFVREVKKRGGVAEKFKTPGRRSAPDRIVSFAPAHVEFVECKRPGRKPTPKQYEDHDRRRAMGFRVHVVDTKERARYVAELIARTAKEWEE